MSEEIYHSKLRELELLKEKHKVMKELPHLYGWPWYEWAWEFFNSTADVSLLCAANQISKSSTQIRKCIHWATDQSLWPKLWARKPNQFWYLYPSKDVATIEFEKKWVPEFLPRADQQTSDHYGWEAEYDKKHIKALHFKNDMTVYFKTYAQDPDTLQSGSCFAVMADEELPHTLYDELKFRLAGTNGYFSMVFTATLGQEFWWRAMEAVGTDQELLHSAWKRQVSMYDCLKYMDGSPSPWTVERIKKIEASCRSRAEVLRRVYGRFIREEGRKYHGFDPVIHYCPPFHIPREWSRYIGVDIGSGGQTGHPSAIVFIAVRPDMKKGYVYKGWRGDGVQTTAGDVYNKVQSMIEPGESFVGKKYDFSCKDFGTISNRVGGGFTKAEKSHDLGEHIFNTLFKHGMLEIFDDDELRKLGSELITLQKSTPKRVAKDDFTDAGRYACVDIPWDFSEIEVKEDQIPEPVVKRQLTEKELIEEQIKERRAAFFDPRDAKDLDWGSDIEAEINEFNGDYGN